MNVTIATTNLTKRFGSITAVEDLDLEVSRGEVFGFLGPNGAGKTTTIRLLLDILRPSAGTIEVLGQSPSEHAVRSRIGFMPSDLRVEPRYSVREAIQFFGGLRGGFHAADVRDLLSRFDLDPGRLFGELSSGNRRKVGVVLAFAGRPDLLVLDEPSTGLDPLLQHELTALLRERVAAGATVFLSSHDLPEVERVADRVAILRAGRLVALGTLDELLLRVRQRVELHLDHKVEPNFFDGVPGVVAVSAMGNVLSLTVEGSVDPVLKRAHQLTVQRVVSHVTDLEDAFLELYR